MLKWTPIEKDISPVSFKKAIKGLMCQSVHSKPNPNLVRDTSDPPGPARVWALFTWFPLSRKPKEAMGVWLGSNLYSSIILLYFIYLTCQCCAQYGTWMIDLYLLLTVICLSSEALKRIYPFLSKPNIRPTYGIVYILTWQSVATVSQI